MPRLNNGERNQAIWMLNAGMSTTVVSLHFGCARKTIERLRRRFRVTGNVADRPRSGRPRATTATNANDPRNYEASTKVTGLVS